MKLLITGGAGFIGANFIHYWLNKYSQDQIINLDKITYAGNLASLQSLEDNPRYVFLKGDICDTQIVKKAIKGVDVVVHFAAESHVDRSIKNPGVFVKTNVLGTQVLLEAALKEKVKRFHHISTDEVFGSLRLDEKRRWTEEGPYAPRSPYAASKAGADHLARAYFTTYNMPVTISNCSNNFGPYQFPEKLIPLAVTNLIQGKKVSIYGDGKYVRDWLYVEDHCRAVDLILKKGKPGETYLIGAENEEIYNIDLIKKILAIMDKDEKWINFVEDRPGHDKKYALSAGKLKKELSWQSEHSFQKALSETIKWYLENDWWWQPLKS